MEAADLWGVLVQLLPEGRRQVQRDVDRGSGRQYPLRQRVAVAPAQAWITTAILAAATAPVPSGSPPASMSSLDSGWLFQSLISWITGHRLHHKERTGEDNDHDHDSPSGEPEAHGSNGRQGGRRGPDGRLRRMWQRRASRLAVGVVAAAVALTAAAVALAQGIGQFRDVPGNHYARDSVEWAIQNNITYGCRDGTYFCPERTVTRAESVTFLHRYHNNVIRQLENRIRALESGSVQGSNPNTGFGSEPTSTTTTAPLRKYTTRGNQGTVRSFTLVPGTYDAVFTLEAVKAATAHDEPRNDTTADCQAGTRSRSEAVTRIQVEYRDRSSSVWKTHAVSALLLKDANSSGDTDNLPAAGFLVSTTPDVGVHEVIVEDVPGRLPPSGSLRVSAYMADNTIDRGRSPGTCDTDEDPDRTTHYVFDWGLVLTEKRD